MSNEQPNDKDLDDWESKYDITLNMLQNEYLVYLSTIKDCDEKVNKYLVVISIFMAGIFAVISSGGVLEKLEFAIINLNLIHILSFVFIALLCSCVLLSLKVVLLILESLEYVESRRLPDLFKKLHEYGECNSPEYKNILIQCYQEAINVMGDSISKKQVKVRNIASEMKKFIYSIILLMFILILLNLIGKAL